MATLRLDCSICPNNPHFSDLSHLLTHLASKGHLSHEFKAKMRAEQDPTFRAVFEHFERWKRDNDLNKLLNERLQQKEKKKGGARQAQRSQGQAGRRLASQNTAQSQDLPELQHNGQARHATPRITGVYGPTALIDPILTARRPVESPNLRRSNRGMVKREFGEMGLQYGYDSDDLEQDLAAMAPQPYPTTAYQSQNPMVHRSIARAQGFSTGSNSVSRQSSASPSLPSAGLFRRRDSDTSVTDDPADKCSLASGNVQDHDEDNFGGSPSLKGITWPGMTMFDAASPRSRRLRNQKKDRSTLDAMEAYSETIEPTETIQFFPSWELKKKREITGQVESSEEEVHAAAFHTHQKPKVRRPKSRAALAQLDRNQTVRKASCSGKDSVKSPAPTTLSTVSTASSDPLPNLNAGLPSTWQTEDDDDAQWNRGFGSGLHKLQNQHKPQRLTYHESVPQDRAQPQSLEHEEDADLIDDAQSPSRLQLPSLRSLTAVQSQHAGYQSGVAGLTADAVQSQMRRDSYGYQNARNVRNSNAYGAASNGTGPDANSKGDNFGYPDVASQRYFSMADAQLHFSHVSPAHLDFTIGHQQGRLMPSATALGNSSYGGFSFDNPPFYPGQGIDNPLSMFSTNSPMHNSPARNSQRGSSMNPLLDMSMFGTSGNGVDDGQESFHERFGEE